MIDSRIHDGAIASAKALSSPALNRLLRACAAIALAGGSVAGAQTPTDPIRRIDFEDCTPLYPGGAIQSWNAVFATWPSFGVRRRLLVPNASYISLQFTAAADPSQFGTLATTDFPGDGEGSGWISISRSPGCFDPDHLQPNCLSPIARTPSLNWANGASLFACQLVVGETYYVNMTFGNTGIAGPNCPSGGACGADVQNLVQ